MTKVVSIALQGVSIGSSADWKKTADIQAIDHLKHISARTLAIMYMNLMDLKEDKLLKLIRELKTIREDGGLQRLCQNHILDFYRHHDYEPILRNDLEHLKKILKMD